MLLLLYTFLSVAGAILALAVGLSLLPRIRLIGGRRAADHLARAPLLDILVAGLTWVPWVVGFCNAGWLGALAAFAGQVVAMLAWVTWHERVHASAARGPTIRRTLNRIVGRFQNHAALWVSLLALPGFWMIRIHEILVYPLLRLLLGFPYYKHGDWVNCSRQKFEGLVGHDLIWCLYCDWMTGVYSLGAEMLRTVESFWCPIRFYDGKKCENCKVDFPDIEKGWVPADGSMEQVVDTLDKQYCDGQREWFGHAARLTVKGKTPRNEE